MKKCKCGCGHSMKGKHPNAKFWSQKHKDRYWNRVNPRGMYAPKERHPYDETDHPFEGLNYDHG